RDASTDPPAFPPLEIGQEFLDELPTFGRGLGIVSISREAWGPERECAGTLVWFVPASSPPPAPVPGVLLGWDDDDGEASFGESEVMVVHLLHVPAELLQGPLAPGAELRRELRLLALAHQDTYPIASDLSAFFASLARDIRGQLGGEALLTALQTGQAPLAL